MRLKKPSPKKIFVAIGTSLVIIALALPFLARTSTYPVAVVDGNSMYPTLKSGDLVFFTAPPPKIANGTIIVFVQSSSGIPALDSLLRPVLIHRVVNVGQEPDGTTDYNTKGDNNQVADPFTTDQGNVLGVPFLVIPYAGLPILFLQTPYGLVSVCAAVTLYFLTGVDSKMEESNERKKLVALFARHSLNGEISPRQFERLKLAVEYFDDMSPDLLTDPTMISAIDWLKGGGLSTSWEEEKVPCPDCNTPSFSILSGDKSFLICPKCCEQYH
jgi:signal peptidase I